MTMTAVPDVPTSPAPPRRAPTSRLVPAPVQAAEATARPPSRPGRVIAWWVVVSLASVLVVLYTVSPMVAHRDQTALLADYRTQLVNASNESQTIAGVTTPTKPPVLGSPVGVLEIGALQVQQVAVEGATPSQTAIGPAHVPGTAGPGQPGNAVLVARRSMFGGPFADLGGLHRGDQILLTTTQGQSVYVVDTVGDRTIEDAGPATTAATPAEVDPYAAPGTTVVAAAQSRGAVPAEEVFGPSADDRLTLVTSASAVPWNGTDATVVVAKLQGSPFPPTPQGGRYDGESGRSADASALPPLVLATLAYGAAISAAVVLYRRASLRVAYLLTAAPLLVGTIVFAETAARLLPAWA